MDNKKSSENKSTQGNCEYDNDLVFRQGIAIVSKNQKFGAIMVGGKEIVPPIYDALSDFVDGFATAKLWNEERTINLSGQIQVKKGEDNVFLPQEYDWGYDFDDNICIVGKINRQINWQPVGRFGIISIKNNPNSTEYGFDELLPCEYSSISPLIEGLFLISKDNSYGLIKGNGEIIAETKYYKITIVAKKYFQLELIDYQTHKHLYCIINENGEFLTPDDCSEIKHISVNDSDYWIVTKYKLKGVYYNKTNIIPLEFEEINLLSDSFECTRFPRFRETIVRYNHLGQVVINHPSRQIIFPSEYSMVLDSPIGLFRAMMDGKWGIINQKMEWIVPNKYENISPFQNGFAIITERAVGKEAFFLDEQGNPNGWSYKDCQHGLIDTLGNVVLPTEYELLWLLDGNWIIRKDGKYGLLSSSLSEIIPPTYSEMEYLKKGYYYAELNSKKLLIDNTGKVIIPTGSFDKIELFGDSFFKLIKFNEAGFSDRDKRSIVNQNGETIVKYDYYREISYIGDGLMILDQMYEGEYLVNLQGERIYERAYKMIKKRDDGLFSLESGNGWGVGNVSGKILIDTEYYDEIEFKKGVAKIKVSWNSDEHKVNREGRVIVLDGEKEIKLPESVYWGTNFTNGISIVRRKNDGYGERNIVGVADVNENIIIPAQYHKICLLSDNTIRVKEEDACGIFGLNCYGIFDLKGKVIFPPIFTLIKYISEDRIRVCWNVNIAKEWNNTGYTPGVCEEKDKHSTKFLEGYRAALCNSKGEIVNDKKYLYVGTFTNQYAPAYKEVVVENGKVRYKKGGVIDVTGKTIIKPQYDTIKLIKDIPYIVVWSGGKVGIIDYSNNTILEPIYDALLSLGNSHFARVKKDGKIGLVDLQSKKERFFEELNIQRIGRVDSLGRCAYSEDSEKGTWGVISIDGIVVPTGKYKGVKLLDNGLIRVSTQNEEWPSNPLHGLLNSKGEEILPLKYTEISSFDNNRAKICIGGEYDDEYDEIKDGKWGVVDITGKIIVDCNYDGIWLNEDGTIKVSDKSGELPLYGLLDENGNEILPIKCTSISSFVNERAVVRIGAHKVDDYEFRQDIIGGKWSLIDRNGNFIIEEITVPSGLIDSIKLLNNGLMIVKKCYEEYDKYGLLDENGNELLPVRYSDISDFKDGLATICIGGEPDFFTGEATREKWGIIDSKGKFIKECKYTWKEINGETDENNDNKGFQAPSVIMSDTIECNEPSYADSYEEASYDDDYSSYRKYGGYNGYDDNTIDEAFDGDPSLTWNVD